MLLDLIQKLNLLLKKQGKIWLRPFPSSSVTKKPDGARMGKGKGNHKVWVCLVNKGETLLDTVNNILAMKVDIIVLRHPNPGSAVFLSRVSSPNSSSIAI